MAASAISSRKAPGPLGEPIAPATVAAVGLHLLLLGVLGFNFDWPENARKTIAVTVALTPTARAPEHAKHVAAENQQGEEQAPEPVPETRTQVRMQTSLTISREMEGGDGPRADDASPEELAERLNALEQSLSSLSDSSAARNPRVGSVAARRSLDAEYLSRWRARVEQVGNALYRGEPPAGNGDVRLLVSVLADGTLERVRILQSSGNADLDQSAEDTVVLAAPFPRFSPELAKFTRRLEIVRTWQFRTQALSSD